LPPHVETHSEALRDPQTTSLGHIVAAETGGKNLSGFRLLTSGEEALGDLIALADHAERTLDIQYYIIQQDDSARILLHHVRLAADRGVRVRVLVDDLNTAGEDRRFMHLSEHVNVEVRVFNPFPGGRHNTWTRVLASANDFGRINHRMHNKLFVADNALAITGGRNIGDQYFTRDQHNNFIDLDVVAAGAIVPELSASFDAFWNSKFAYPIASVAEPVNAEPASPPPSDGGDSATVNWLEGELRSGKVQLTWVPATVLADRPAKIASETSPDEEVTIANNIGAGDDRAGPERDFAQQRVARVRKDIEVLGPTAVPRVDEPGSAGGLRGHAEPEAGLRMRHARGPDLEAGDREGPLVERLDVERGGAKAWLAVERIKSLVETLRGDHADAPAGLLPAQVVAQRNEIDEVVRMEMADNDRVERRRIERFRKPGERALAEVEEHARITVAEQVRSARGTGSIGVRGPRTDHIEVHRGDQDPPDLGPVDLSVGCVGGSVLPAPLGSA
jgi:HKD family nuclease